jgi:MOSC domain-containing protein YiiM
MNGSELKIINGRVASLHLHPVESGGLLRGVDAIEVVFQKGIHGNGRYFGRKSRHTGEPSRRQVSLIGREQIAEHAVATGLGHIPPGVVRSNIETEGIDLIALLGSHVVVGESILHFYEARTPCYKMDLICDGLKQRMENNRQGVMAEVIQPGIIRVGDAIRPLPRL